MKAEEFVDRRLERVKRSGKGDDAGTLEVQPVEAELRRTA